MNCSHCGEPLDDGIAGVARSIGALAGISHTSTFHTECLMRTFIGSVGHLKRTCCCYVPGSVQDDPPWMTKRQAARAALRLYNRLNAREASNDN